MKYLKELIFTKQINLQKLFGIIQNLQIKKTQKNYEILGL